MKKPGPVRKEQLKHPADKRSAWNGDKWRNDKKVNYTSRVSTTTGSRPPTNTREVPIAHINPDGSISHGKDITDAVRPIPTNHVFQVYSRPSDRQSEMIYKKKGCK